jgi:hypothetical protein
VAKEKFKLAHVEAALRSTGGIVTAAAKKLRTAYGSCTPASVRNYIQRHPSLQRAVEEVIEENLDLAEHKLLAGINADNMTASIFYLKTKGRRRGYVERGELTGPNGAPLPTHTTVVTIMMPPYGRDAPPEKSSESASRHRD